MIPSTIRTLALTLGLALSMQPAIATAQAVESPPSAAAPPRCLSWYQPLPDESCNDVVRSHPGISLRQLYQWNPDLYRDCSNLPIEGPICIRA